MRPQLVGQSGIGQQAGAPAVVVLMNQDAARQDAQRSLDHAHVLVQHQMMDIGAVEQRADRGNQHHIVGPDQFRAMGALSFSPGCTNKAVRAALCAAAILPLPRSARHVYYCRTRISANWPNWRPGVAVIVPFESPSTRVDRCGWSSLSPPTWSGSTPRSCRGPGRKSP